MITKGEAAMLLTTINAHHATPNGTTCNWMSSTANSTSATASKTCGLRS